MLRVNRKQGAFSIGINELNNINNQIKPGCCPHGLPAGACPVCSKSGGGSLHQSDRNRKIGEMTYHECAMIGNMLRARALAQKRHEASLKEHEMNVEKFKTVMEKLAQNIKEFMQIASKSFVLKPVAFVLNITVIPVFSLVKNIPKVFQMLKYIRFEIMDKLNALFGEAKAFLNKKMEELIKIAKMPFNWLSKIFKKNNSDNEDTKIDDDKKIFNLKTIIKKIKEKFRKKKDKQK